MTQFDRLLQLLEDELLYPPNPYAEISSKTQVELLDGQTAFRSGVVYIVTAKQAAALLKAPPAADEGSFLFVANASAPVVQHTPLQKQVTCVELSSSLGHVFNLINGFLRDLAAADEQQISTFEQFLDAVLERRFSSESAVREHAAGFFPGLKAFYRIVLVHFTPECSAEHVQQLKDALEALLPGLYLHPYHRDLAGFYLHEERQISLPLSQSDQEKLQALMDEYHAELSISNATRHYDMLRTMFLLCSRVMTLGHVLHLPDVGSVYHVERFSMYNVIDLAVQRFIEVHGHTDVIYLIHPAVVQLTRYDHEHNSRLRDTLYYYLLNDSHLVRTAKALYMHRNTVINKINKVVELTGVDLTDGGLCQRLAFSCQMIQYYEQIMGLTMHL